MALSDTISSLGTAIINLVDRKISTAATSGTIGKIATTQNIATLSSGAISLSSTNSIYKITPSAATTFTFGTSGLSLTSSEAYTFELCVNMSTVYALTFPSSVTWQDNETPDLSSTGTYLLVFRTMDAGTSWIGNLQGGW